MTLEQASIAKLEVICDKLDLGPADHVLEIGTGWGGFAVHAAPHARLPRDDHHDLAASSTTTRSSACGEAGVEHLVEVLLDDYRDLRGSYDKLVSIEMIEAVGWRTSARSSSAARTCSRRTALMLLQAITIDDRAYEVEKASKSFIRHLRLPERLPAFARGDRALRCTPHRLAHRHLEDLTPHYAETLRRWRANFEAAAEDAGVARLRRALPPAVADVPVLLRGRLRRAQDRPVQTLLAKPEYRAGMHRPRPPAGDRLSYARPPAEHPRADGVEQAAGPRAASLATAGPAARAEDVVVVLDRGHDLRRPLLRLDPLPPRRVHVAPVDLLGASSMSVSTPGVTRCRTLDAGAAQLSPQRLAERHHAGLRRRVCGGGGELRVAADRRVVHDLAAAAARACPGARAG